MCIANLLAAATGMVKLYSDYLEGQKLNTRTGKTWVLSDVPLTYRTKVSKNVIADGYHFDAEGKAVKNEA